MLNFLLIQNDEVLGVSNKPSKLLAIDTLDPKQSWSIVLGKDKKIIRPIVTFTAKPRANVYRVSSPLDLNNRLMGHCGNSIAFALYRIDIFENHGRYNDESNLPIIEFCESNT